MGANRLRADVFLVDGGYVSSRTQAKKLIEDGCVTVDGNSVKHPSQEIDIGEHTVTVQNRAKFVSRGGEKLEKALTAFEINPDGWNALDIGASTGGFTDCLLSHGVAHVTAVDSGSGQLAQSVRNDPRVRSIEHCNARYLTGDDIGGKVRLIVMDVSFISATLILPRFPELSESIADAVCLVKPQFEVGRALIGKGGIVRDKNAHKTAIERVADCAESLGMTVSGLIPSPIYGGDGNREFLLHLTVGQNKKAITKENITFVVNH